MIQDIQSTRDIYGNQYKKPSTKELNGYIEEVYKWAESQGFLKLQRNLSDETIKNFNIGYDFYRRNIIIPEYKNRELINFAYRALEDNPKIKYAKEKGCENWIFNEQGIEEAKKKGGVLITSNQFDAMSVWQMGFKNVVSIPVGKDAVGEWMNLFDGIPNIYISFENNKKMKKFGIDFADRLNYGGIDRCYEIQLPEDINDLNSFFKVKTSDDFKELVRNAKPFYKYTYQDLGSVLDAIVERGDARISIDILPIVKIDIDYLFLILGKSGYGKSTYVMNIAKKLLDVDIPTMVIPYERGYRTVGEKFLQIQFNKTEDEIKGITKDEYIEMKDKVKDLPLMFSKPDIDKIRETTERAKKLFGVRAIIIDHIEYDTNKGSGEVEKLSIVMRELKQITLELGVMMFVVNHVKKSNTTGALQKDIGMEDSIGSGNTFRVAEGVIVVQDMRDGTMKVKLDKSNHSATGYKIYEYDGATGVIGKEVGVDTSSISSKYKQGSLDDF